MRREVIEFITAFKKDFNEVEAGIIFTAETDFEKLEEILKKMSEIFLRYHKQAEELKRKVLERKRMIALG